MALGFAPHFFHHWQFAVSSGADHKSVAFPRYVLLDRQGRVSELVPEFFRWPFLAFADLPMIDHDIVFIGASVDLEETEREFVEAHNASSAGVLGALPRGDGGESGPALLDSLAAAVGAQHLAFFVVHKREDLVEEFLAFLAEEFVVGHADLHNFRRVTE